MDKEFVRAHVVIVGRVQGVFFRMNTLGAVERTGGVTGWVRNRKDGTVEAVFEGEKSNVEAVLSWCRKGDPPARVQGVQTDWKPYTGAFDRFEITH